MKHLKNIPCKSNLVTAFWTSYSWWRKLWFIFGSEIQLKLPSQTKCWSIYVWFTLVKYRKHKNNHQKGKKKTFFFLLCFCFCLFRLFHQCEHSWNKYKQRTQHTVHFAHAYFSFSCAYFTSGNIFSLWLCLCLFHTCEPGLRTISHPPWFWWHFLFITNKPIGFLTKHFAKSNIFY